jgi:hypothetical protein
MFILFYFNRIINALYFHFVFLKAINASQRSQKECRVYVGNLAYEVKWGQLKDFMRQGL